MLLGNKVRMEGALVHNDFEDWNFDASIVETPTPLLLMNLLENNNDVAFGQLVVGGSLDLLYWDGDLDIRGDLAAFEGTDLRLALLTEETEGWNNTVEFLQPTTAIAEEEVMPDEDEIGMLIDLNLETKPRRQNHHPHRPRKQREHCGHTQGNLHVLMDDWEHMTLNGELDIGGRYDLAFGSLVRKTFVAKPEAGSFGTATRMKARWIWKPCTPRVRTFNRSWGMVPPKSKTRMSKSCFNSLAP